MSDFCIEGCGSEIYEARIAELEGRLELRLPDGREAPADGIACRDETIALQDKRIAELERAMRQLQAVNSANSDEIERLEAERDQAIVDKMRLRKERDQLHANMDEQEKAMQAEHEELRQIAEKALADADQLRAALIDALDHLYQGRNDDAFWIIHATVEGLKNG